MGIESESETKMRNRHREIDFIRGVAILAVFTNHISVLQYRMFLLTHHVFAVSVFMICAGITSAIVIKDDCDYSKYVGKKMMRIVVPYCIATTTYHLFYNHVFIIEEWFKDIVFCRQSQTKGEMYFIFFFVQLILIAPFLVRFFRKAEEITLLGGCCLS